MHLNWFTVIAQVINFLILVWLLKRYLYKPILNAVDEREKKITSQLKDAEAKKAEANREKDEFNKKNDAFDQQKKEMTDKAVAETEKERQKLLEEARNEADALRAKLEKTLEEMRQNIDRDIAQRVQQQVFAISGKALNDLASVSLEEQIISIFLKRLNGLSDAEKVQFIAAFKSGNTPVVVRSAFDLTAMQKAEIESSFDKLSGIKNQFQFKTDNELISGIELTANGFKLTWSIAGYLGSLQKNLSESLKEEPNSA